MLTILRTHLHLIPSPLLPTLPTLPILLSNLKLDLPILHLLTSTNTPLPHLQVILILLQAPLLPLNNMLILLPLSIAMVKVLITGREFE